MKLVVLVILSFSIRCSYAQPKNFDAVCILSQWESVDDSSWKFIFKEQYFWDVYSNHGKDSVTYEVLDYSTCNDKYITDDLMMGEVLFLNTYRVTSDSHRCYEITSLDSTNLALRETGLGRVFVFRRIKPADSVNKKPAPCHR